MEKNQYSKEFKLGAARMAAGEGMRSAQVCKDLGISASASARWIRNFRKNGNGSFPGKGKLAPEDAKVRELERKCRRLRMERDILKKRSRCSRNSTGKVFRYESAGERISSFNHVRNFPSFVK